MLTVLFCYDIMHIKPCISHALQYKTTNIGQMNYKLNSRI